jgi:hypothetical protein
VANVGLGAMTVFLPVVSNQIAENSSQMVGILLAAMALRGDQRVAGWESFDQYHTWQTNSAGADCVWAESQVPVGRNSFWGGCERANAY